MRYNLESTLPINAFSPRGGRSPFAHGMTLEGGGGSKGMLGSIMSAVQNNPAIFGAKAGVSPTSTTSGFGNIASSVANSIAPTATQNTAFRPGSLGGTLYQNNPAPAAQASSSPTGGFVIPSFSGGGNVHGIKAIAQDLSKYGRGGDTMVAHINPQEAALLKSMGGSGTINPTTGLPEFLNIGKVFKPVTNALGSVAKVATQAVKGVVQPVYNATLKNIPGVDRALVNVDKAVGKSIPGGWGTVASVAASFIPGAQLALMGMTSQGLATGLGALSGSGVMRGNHEFNLQGAIMGGAMAYGASEITQGLQEAGNATSKSIEAAAKGGGESALANTGSAAVEGASRLTPTANALQNIPTDFVPPINAPTAAQAFSNAGEYGLKNIAASAPVGEFAINPAIQSAVPTLGGAAPTGILDSLASGTGKAISGAGSNMATAGQGLANLSGLAGSEGTAAAARSAFTNAVTTPGLAGLTMGGAGLAALEEQQKYLDEQKAAGALGNAEYNAAKAKIDEQVATARAAVSANPLKTNADMGDISKGPSLYNKDYAGFDTLYDKEPTGGTTLYAMGGQVNPPDDQTGMPNQTPMGNFEGGGLMSMIGRTAPPQMYASGGMASGQFLSGGGDGMSDSIKASINGNQEARLADGEFVVPADVVSHIGNGSSKAGAKQLYSMMDRVRQARVGTKKQGKQINPRKYLAA